MMNYRNSNPTISLLLKSILNTQKCKGSSNTKVISIIFKKPTKFHLIKCTINKTLMKTQRDMPQNAKTFELFATCMERHEGKIDNIAKYLSMKMLFIEKQALQCYKVNTNDREYESCHQRVEQQLHDVYSEYYQGLLHL